MPLKIIAVLIILAAGFFGLNSLQANIRPQPTGYSPIAEKQPDQQSEHNQPTSGGYGTAAPFYSKDGITLEHYWPGEANFSNEETEVLVFNNSSSKIEVKSFDMEYMVAGKTYPHKSGTWEKFPTTRSWDRIEYLNISPQYYKGEPLILEIGQKGKLHWHINFGSSPLDGKQTVEVKLTFIKNGKTITTNEKLTRDSGTVFSKDGH